MLADGTFEYYQDINNLNILSSNLCFKQKKNESDFVYSSLQFKHVSNNRNENQCTVQVDSAC